MNAKKHEDPPKPPRRRVKKVKGHGGHHGGAWKVASADFVTAMMALFLVLWLVSQADMKLKQAIANYFRAPGVFDTVQGGILSQAKKVSQEPQNLTSKDDEQMLFETAQRLREQFSSRPEFSKYKDQVKIEITDEGLRIQLVDDAEQVSFPTGSSELTPEARAILETIANDLCTLPNKINVGGHTDSRVYASPNGYTNWELSTDRANAARRVIDAVCVRPNQIHRVVGFADTVPLDPNDPYAAANRRISITVLRLAQTDPPTAAADPAAAPPAPAEPRPARPAVAKNAAQPAASPAEQAPLPSDTDEARSKLKKEGSVSVGEPDELPSVPKVKAPELR